ncbi:lipase maturation factor 2a isoform X1 [Latimeria chalumnae]|uniref:lipase maturation factor 2a isoform X1 n=1 Tax=Latimeria chalumnae TaxID=7897 RepID=UPI00313BC3DD
MGDITLPRRCFLWSLSVIYVFAFASIYLQVPGLYGRDGILPARRMLRYTGKPLLEQLRDMPTLLWLGPHLGLETEQGMELLCLLGVLLSLGAMVMEPLRDSLVFFCLWVLYLSLYQVGQVFLYFQWDSLLLETGFLAILVAPFHMLRSKSSVSKPHDRLTFWLLRWLFFRLMFASGVVKLTSRCPTWWGLTALTYHYETQCIPTPVAWFAHQLPVWFQKLSVVATYIIEIPLPLLFFLPIRSLRLFSFYMQVLLQVLIILTGNYNFFNLLTVALGFSLLDNEHVEFWLQRGGKKTTAAATTASTTTSHSQVQKLQWAGLTLAQVAAYGLLCYWTVSYFGLQLNLEKLSVQSRIAFTYHEFMQWLKAVIVPTVWIGALSLTWEIVAAMFRCAVTRGFFWKLWTTVQWAIFATAAAGMFAISVVPYTYLEYEANSNVWPGARKLFEATDRYQLANSYGLFRRMTGVGGRPEVVVEGSYDRETWTEIEFMYKPGNISATPLFVAPHQPRLDWQMWFAALGHHSHSPWFTSFVYRLLQGKKEVMHLVQTDESKYPFSLQPPTYIRAQLYKYWFTELDKSREMGPHWWRRQHVEEFYPTVSLGDSTLETMLQQYGLKDPSILRRSTDAFLPQTLKAVRDFTWPYTAPSVLWALFFTGLAILALKALLPMTMTPQEPSSKKKAAAGGGEDDEKNGQVKRQEGKWAERPEARCAVQENERNLSKRK